MAGKIILIPFSAKLTADENRLLLALRAHIEARDNSTISKSDVVRLGLEALASSEKRRGFKL